MGVAWSGSSPWKQDTRAVGGPACLPLTSAAINYVRLLSTDPQADVKGPPTGIVLTGGRKAVHHTDPAVGEPPGPHFTMFGSLVALVLM